MRVAVLRIEPATQDGRTRVAARDVVGADEVHRQRRVGVLEPAVDRRARHTASFAGSARARSSPRVSRSSSRSATTGSSFNNPSRTSGQSRSWYCGSRSRSDASPPRLRTRRGPRRTRRPSRAGPTRARCRGPRWPQRRWHTPRAERRAHHRIQVPDLFRDALPHVVVSREAHAIPVRRPWGSGDQREVAFIDPVERHERVVLRAERHMRRIVVAMRPVLPKGPHAEAGLPRNEPPIPRYSSTGRPERIFLPENVAETMLPPPRIS